ncbi:MAG: hypothetical protein EXS36_10355 [Pedosphaera sp.]|nr:hypothetical protein [Pedosphaera sp.]
MFEKELSENRRLWDAWTAVNTVSAFYDVQRFRDDADDVRIEPWARSVASFVKPGGIFLSLRGPPVAVGDR